MKKTAFLSFVFIAAVLAISFGVVLVAQAGTCGDGTCKTSEGENCANCPVDCACCNICCCDINNPNISISPRGCVAHGFYTSTGICCNATNYAGGVCCDGTYCPGGECVGHQCVTSSSCGNGVCDDSESCSSCPSDCGACKKTDGTYCTAGSECLGGYCVHYKCSSGSTYCGDAHCEGSETCSSCSSDCGACPAKKSDGDICYGASECQGGYCVHYYCRSSPIHCGDSFCDSGESNSSCSLDCIAKAADGSACVLAYECQGGYCVHYKCSSGSTYCGDAHCEGSETCSSCSSDCGACPAAKKANGESCSLSSECSGGHCLHGKCRSSATYCGDNYCDSGETCSSCSSDCGACEAAKKKDGVSCYSASECQGSNCVHGICRSLATFCGDNYCDSGETCTSCSSDCGVCAVTKKTDGSVCSLASECKGGYCLHQKCRSSAAFCGDSYCDSNETCTSCSSDCGACPVIKKPDGSACSSVSECEGGYCVKGKCSSSPTFCGDGTCSQGENCSSCPSDCKCSSGQCCSSQSKNANSKGCVVSNQITTTGSVCCQGYEYPGGCCQDIDCPGGKTCFQHQCMAEAACGNNSCQYWLGENCQNCSNDCSCFNGEICASNLSKSDLFGCIKASRLTKEERSLSEYIWCESSKQEGNCCYDGDCGLGERCTDHVCKTAPKCGDGICQKEENENCLTCQSDCSCSYNSCCVPESSSANAKGCVAQKEKLSNYSICCDGQGRFGNCCSQSQCGENEECWENWCRAKPRCGDGICHYELGENCKTCSSDCSCYGNDCCSPGAENADKAGCIQSGQKTSSSACCFGKLEGGDCCSDYDCGYGEKCLDHVCSVPKAQCPNNICEYEKGENCACGDCACSANECCEPYSENKNNKGCVLSGKETLPGQICCQGKTHYGNCCSDSDCQGGEKCVGNHCTKFLDLFYKYYYRSEVAYQEGFVNHSDLYRGIANFYRETASQIDVPIMSLGKFVKALDAISDTARSIVSVDIIGITSNISKFFDEMATWELPGTEKVQNNIVSFYSAASLAYEFADRYGNIQPAVQALSSKLPFNNVLKQISKKHAALQGKIASPAEANQLFYFEVADLVMDATLLAEVDDYLRYDVLDYQQKIQLSIIARELATLYEKAEKHNLSEKEAWVLMSLEKEFWVEALARSTNYINFEEVKKEQWMTQIYNALGANSAASIQAETETKNSAETWLVGLENRRKVLFSVYLGRGETGNGWANAVSSPFGSLINAFKSQNILK